MQRSGSFDRFTERARKVLTLAQEEAQRFNHNYIGTEHILLGLIRESDSVGMKVLIDLGVEPEKIRGEVESLVGRGEQEPRSEIGLTPQAKRVIELAVDEARRLGHRYIGTEHFLLGMIREGEGIPANVLERLGVNLEIARAGVIEALTTNGSTSPEPKTRAVPPVTLDPSDREWEHLVVPTVFRDGIAHVRPPIIGGTWSNGLENLRIHHALQVLGDEGWELAAIDSTYRTEEGPGSLYIFKRPR